MSGSLTFLRMSTKEIGVWKPGTLLRRLGECAEQYARVRSRVVGGTLVDLLGPSHYGGTMVIPCSDTQDYAAEWGIVADASMPQSVRARDQKIAMRKH